MGFQSTPPVRGATETDSLRCWLNCVSIHAPRAGSDVIERLALSREAHVSIHAPRAGSDFSVRKKQIEYYASFNPRPPCGERHGATGIYGRGASFNPRPPCGERLVDTITGDLAFLFQSTPPVRGATLTTILNCKGG
ncbi:Uncharacterized protein dnm_098540 [Desulfonema magnum]|uniref:Uncharacterized protein n=1 Tax=Desulfonema magnum TaxID=45655 RepID=A0A975GU38_9BACT|nr:Uncharacterized protein dnm_098540 [Desulfonema magnum]